MSIANARLNGLRGAAAAGRFAALVSLPNILAVRKAVEEGRSAEHVRPYTTHRRHVIYRRIA